MRVAILPSGALFADAASSDDEASDGLSAAARVRVARAFARGPGHALLDLGATELDAPLSPPLTFLRDLGRAFVTRLDRKSTRLNSSHLGISYAVFCLKKKNKKTTVHFMI